MLKEVTLLFLTRDVTTETGALSCNFSWDLVLKNLDRQKDYLHAPINQVGLARFDNEARAD